MGQYYEPVCLDKKQYLNSWNFGNGAKLIEHSWRGNNFVEAVVQLLSPGAPWYKKRLVWAGDYADEGKFLDLKWSQKNLKMISDEVNSYQDDKIKDLTLEEKLNYINLHSVANICFKKIVPEDLDKYSSVTVVVVEPKYFSHFSRMVKIPIRISATGRVNVKGKRASRTVPSNNI